MFYIVLCIQLILQAVPVQSEVPPAPPLNVHVDNWLLTWTPAPKAGNVTYTIQYSSFESNGWKNVPACIQISSTKCNVTLTKDEDDDGCVMLRVRAVRRGLKSTPVEACSRQGDSCSPQFSMTALPGYLTVHLSRNNSLALDHGDHLKHRVYYGKEGEPLEGIKEEVSSVSIDGLQEGQRYCMKVQYIYFDVPIGPPSCIRCKLIPESKKDSGQTGIIVGVVLFLLLVALTPAVAYVLIFQKIKRWLPDMRYRITDDFLPNPLAEERSAFFTSSTNEECYDVISSITPLQSSCPPPPPASGSEDGLCAARDPESR